MIVFPFFFFKQKTAYEMRISDWSSDVCSSDLELQRGEARVEAAGCRQLAVAAALDQAALVDHQDAVGLQHGGEAVGDDQRRASGHEAVERLLHHALALGIERSGRLVEQQQWWVPEDGAGDGGALTLAAGRAQAILAETGVEALRQRLGDGEPA